jgi:hypothetical protein
VAIVTLGWPAHLFVARFTCAMTEVFVNFNLGRLAFVAFGAVAKFILVIFVVESYGAFLLS